MYMAGDTSIYPTNATAEVRKKMLEEGLTEITLLKRGWYYYWYGHGYVMPVGYEDGLRGHRVRRANEFSLNSWLRRAQMADQLLRMYKEDKEDD